jgi:hypothetical protein
MIPGGRVRGYCLLLQLRLDDGGRGGEPNQGGAPGASVTEDPRPFDPFARYMGA